LGISPLVKLFKDHPPEGCLNDPQAIRWHRFAASSMGRCFDPNQYAF
jgi:hypothetical protein